MEDERLFQKFKITDEIDIVTLKDYMQVRNLDLDIENKQQNKPCDPILQEERIMYQFTVVKYTQYKMYHFKVYNSVALSTFTVLCKHHYRLV